MAISVARNASAIDVARALVRDGVLSIAADGAIWKHFELDRWGYRRPLAPPRRIDHVGSGGYSYLSVCANGRQYVLLAHRLIWAYTFGDIPLGNRISHSGLRHENASHLLALEASMRRDSRTEVWPFMDAEADASELVVQINGAVPKWLYEQLRQDVCQEVAVRVLGDGVPLTPQLVTECIKASRKNAPIMSGYERSLDAPLPGRDNLHHIDRLSTETRHL